MLTVSLWLSHYFNDLSYFHYTPQIPVESKASFVQTVKGELGDSAVLNYLIGLLIHRAYWLLVGLSSILTWENWLLLSNIEERAEFATPSNSTKEKTQGFFAVLKEHFDKTKYVNLKTNCVCEYTKFSLCVLDYT